MHRADEVLGDLDGHRLPRTHATGRFTAASATTHAAENSHGTGRQRMNSADVPTGART
jgi:hypothetical protein